MQLWVFYIGGVTNKHIYKADGRANFIEGEGMMITTPSGWLVKEVVSNIDIVVKNNFDHYLFIINNL